MKTIEQVRQYLEDAINTVKYSPEFNRERMKDYVNDASVLATLKTILDFINEEDEHENNR